MSFAESERATVPPIDTALARKRSARVIVNNNYSGTSLAWLLVLVDLACTAIAAVAYASAFQRLPTSARSTDAHTSSILVMIVACVAMLGVLLWRVRYALQTHSTRFTGSSIWHMRQIIGFGVATSVFGWVAYTWFIQARQQLWTTHEATALFVASVVAPFFSMRAVYKHYRTLRHNIAALEAETVERRQKHSPALGRSPRSARLRPLRQSRKRTLDRPSTAYVDDNVSGSSVADHGGYQDFGDESSDIGQLDDSPRGGRARNRRSLRRGGWRRRSEQSVPLTRFNDPPAELSCAPIDQ